VGLDREIFCGGGGEGEGDNKKRTCRGVLSLVLGKKEWVRGVIEPKFPWGKLGEGTYGTVKYGNP